MEFVSVHVNLTNKRRFVHEARKSDNYGWDEDDKQRVIDIIRNFFGIHCIRSDRINVGSYGRIPDLHTTDCYPTRYIELDGDYHGFGDGITTTNKTRRRNTEYEEKGLDLIVINKSLTDGYDEKKVIDLLVKQGLKPQ